MGGEDWHFKGLSHPSYQDPSWKGCPNQKIERITMPSYDYEAKASVLSSCFFVFFLLDNHTLLTFPSPPPTPLVVNSTFELFPYPSTTLIAAPPP